MRTFDHLLPTLAYPLAFATVSGADLYGFPSLDSDVDIRGMHVLPVEEVIGLDHGPETLQHMGTHDGVEVDLVTHDLKSLAPQCVTRRAIPITTKGLRPLSGSFSSARTS